MNEHPEILNLPRLQDALYPRGKQMLADAARKEQTLSAPEFENLMREVNGIAMAIGRPMLK